MTINRRISRRSAIASTAAFSAAALAAHLPGARMIAAQGSAEYDLIDLGRLDEIMVDADEPSRVGAGAVYKMNDAGQVCGRIGVAADRFSPVVWSATGKMKKLKSGKLGGQANNMNGSGVVVGHQWVKGQLTGLSNVQGGVKDYEGTVATVWRDGEPIKLETLGDEETSWSERSGGFAIDINEDGVIIGTPDWGSGWIRWIDDVPERLPNPAGCKYFNARRINDAGIVAGVARGYDDGKDRVVIIDGDEETVRMEEEGGNVPSLIVAGFNNAGALAITISPGGTFSHFHVAIIGSDSETTFGSPDDEFNFYVQDLNDDGIAVGSRVKVEDSEVRSALLYRESEAIDLNTLVTPAGLKLRTASAINNQGLIAGYATSTDGASHGYLLVPVE